MRIFLHEKIKIIIALSFISSFFWKSFFILFIFGRHSLLFTKSVGKQLTFSVFWTYHDNFKFKKIKKKYKYNVQVFHYYYYQFHHVDAQAFSRCELFGDNLRSSIHDVSNLFFCEAMKLQTPVTSSSDVTDVIDSMKKTTPASKNDG